jgi:hypothetical protein
LQSSNNPEFEDNYEEKTWKCLRFSSLLSHLPSVQMHSFIFDAAFIETLRSFPAKFCKWTGSRVETSLSGAAGG